MKLIYNISLRLSLVLFPLIALWAVVFYFTMMDEINDEADDALEDYSELIVMRVLAGEPLPRSNEGSITVTRSSPLNPDTSPPVLRSTTTIPRCIFRKRMKPSRPGCWRLFFRIRTVIFMN